MIPYLAILVVSVCAICFYRMGNYEKTSGVVWGLLSAALSLTALFVLGWGMAGVLGSQVLLFAGITAYSVWRQP